MKNVYFLSSFLICTLFKFALEEELESSDCLLSSKMKRIMYRLKSIKIQASVYFTH